MGAYEADIQRFLDNLDSYGEMTGLNIDIKNTKVIMADVMDHVCWRSTKTRGDTHKVVKYRFWHYFQRTWKEQRDPQTVLPSTNTSPISFGGK